MKRTYPKLMFLTLLLLPLVPLSARRGGGGHHGSRGHGGNGGRQEHSGFGRHGKNKHHDHDHDHDHDHHDHHHHDDHYRGWRYGGYGGYGGWGGWNDWDYNYGNNVIYRENFYTYPNYYPAAQGNASINTQMTQYPIPQYIQDDDPFNSSTQYINERSNYHHSYPVDGANQDMNGNGTMTQYSPRNLPDGFDPNRGVFLGE